jgi:hypothetical protein
MGVVENHVSEVEGAYRLKRDAKVNSEDIPDGDLEVRRHLLSYTVDAFVKASRVEMGRASSLVPCFVRHEIQDKRTESGADEQ